MDSMQHKVDNLKKYVGKLRKMKMLQDKVEGLEMNVRNLGKEILRPQDERGAETPALNGATGVRGAATGSFQPSAATHANDDSHHKELTHAGQREG